MVEVALSKGVCLGEAECLIVREAVLCELVRAERKALRKVFDHKKFERAPCYLCGYNGERYYQPSTHSCASLYHSAQQQEIGS